MRYIVEIALMTRQEGKTVQTVHTGSDVDSFIASIQTASMDS